MKRVILREEQIHIIRQLIESQSYDVSQIGEIQYSCNFDEDYYSEWLVDFDYEDNEESRVLYFKTEVEYEIELYDSETYHSMGYQNLYYDDIVNEYDEEVADEIMKDCMKNGNGKLEPWLLYSKKIDINDPEQVNAQAVKVLNNGQYFKGCRGFLLTNGIVVYTPNEHNEIEKIDGIESKFDFIKLGNIRLLPQGIDIGKMPTEEQARVLIKIISSYGNEMFYVDYMVNGKEMSKTYSHPSYELVMRDIKSIFK